MSENGSWKVFLRRLGILILLVLLPCTNIKVLYRESILHEKLLKETPCCIQHLRKEEEKEERVAIYHYTPQIYNYPTVVISAIPSLSYKHPN
ncbi:hypothetical protein L873DRAFT_1447715 [Choiromyces venosus 120613-1]|uniref:Uncharacterized protein n=1 Tax=Choiromyces venosus 120613-1 TaxID=1336337 RepID=A0A3N4K4I1_9PEZI|nr:hypothetical protein L873DRAFT_1447715 [Choiromyces venosus 120613-1]